MFCRISLDPCVIRSSTSSSNLHLQVTQTFSVTPSNHCAGFSADADTFFKFFRIFSGSYFDIMFVSALSSVKILVSLSFILRMIPKTKTNDGEIESSYFSRPVRLHLYSFLTELFSPLKTFWVKQLFFHYLWLRTGKKEPFSIGLVFGIQTHKHLVSSLPTFGFVRLYGPTFTRPHGFSCRSSHLVYFCLFQISSFIRAVAWLFILDQLTLCSAQNVSACLKPFPTNLWKFFFSKLTSSFELIKYSFSLHRCNHIKLYKTWRAAVFLKVRVFPLSVSSCIAIVVSDCSYLVCDVGNSYTVQIAATKDRRRHKKARPAICIWKMYTQNRERTVTFGSPSCPGSGKDCQS